MCAKLQARLLCMVPSFKKTPKACKNKFANLFADYKEVKAKNNIQDRVDMIISTTTCLIIGGVNLA